VNLFRRRSRLRISGYRRSAGVTIRWAGPSDTTRVEILAELDEASIPPAPLLLAFVGDELWVAASVRTGAVICDPFRPSAEVATLVRQRARQLIVPEVGLPRPAVMRSRARLPETS
jgi:hypothetical protein